ncbi:MAG TPA: Sec-independent protein translocase protein TatB [Alphaproteobacteria bacterium]|jgi:sec-independent protein translocase protein TatB|nr:Sec-independent protein translocase protein TatB [Alphaproteobacteria bacterium]
MFLDIGWSEMLVIAVVAFIVLGPKELPNVLRTMAGLASKARAASRMFQQQLDEVMREANAADLKRQVDDALRVDPDVLTRTIDRTIDPEGDVNRVWNEATTVDQSASESTSLTPPPAQEPVVSAPSDANEPRIAGSESPEPAPAPRPPEKNS